MSLSNERRADIIAALIEERDGYRRKGLEDRVQEVERQLSLFGAEAIKPSQRAEHRPRKRREARR